MVGEIKGYTDRHLTAKKFLLVTFFFSFVGLPAIFVSLEIACTLGLLAISFLFMAIWQVILSEIVWHEIQNGHF